MDTDLRNRIRHRLAALQSDNGEELFEQVCAEIAPRRIHANIKPSAFVAGHGDRGRDFENIPGHDLRFVGPQGHADGLAPDSKLVGACTLGRSDPPGKVRSDVETICTRGPRPSVIYHFCESDFPTAAQTRLGAWCETEYGVTLHILTGNTLADWLCEPDLEHALQLLGVGAAPAARCVLPPVDTEGFVGRAEELQRLAAALIHAEGAGQDRLAGIHGPPGVGKSGLAVYFARTHLAHFPDGVVGADLRGGSMTPSTPWPGSRWPSASPSAPTSRPCRRARSPSSASATAAAWCCWTTWSTPPPSRRCGPAGAPRCSSPAATRTCSRNSPCRRRTGCRCTGSRARRPWTTCAAPAATACMPTPSSTPWPPRCMTYRSRFASACAGCWRIRCTPGASSASSRGSRHRPGSGSCTSTARRTWPCCGGGGTPARGLPAAAGQPLGALLARSGARGRG